MHYPKDISSNGCDCNTELGWEQVPDELFSCTCTAGFINSDGFCVTCDQLFSGCSNCVPEVLPSQNAVYVGTYDSMPDQLPYVTCTTCSHITEGGSFFDNETGSCALCDQRYEGCLSCSTDGVNCERCKTLHHYSDTSGYGRCVSCSVYHEMCAQCS